MKVKCKAMYSICKIIHIAGGVDRKIFYSIIFSFEFLTATLTLSAW